MDNFDRTSGERVPGSVAIALDVGGPPFTKLRFFEYPTQAKSIKVFLDANHRGRDVLVYGGDCNQTIHAALDELRPVAWAPTFAFIDPEGADVHWKTLRALSNHRKGRPTKVELWILFPSGLFVRELPVDGRSPSDEARARITRMFGTNEWQVIHEARCANEIDPAQAREEYVNLMRWRLEADLGYRYTHAFEVFNEANRPLYHMIFASDHPAGTKIMEDVYAKAAGEFPQMRLTAVKRRTRDVERASGVVELFDPDELDKLLVPLSRPISYQPYKHEPPTLPRSRQQRRVLH